MIVGAGLGGPIEDEYESPADAARGPLGWRRPPVHVGHAGHPPPLDEVRDLVAYVRAHRDGGEGRPFEVVLGGPSPTDATAARDMLGPLIEAGATWWDERRPIDDDINRADLVLRRIEAGPPVL